MTKLSVNINKIALLRNARGRNYPDVLEFSRRFLELGAHGITLHPRPDQRHARYQDVEGLLPLCRQYGRELNVEGYPTDDFMEVVERVRPDQCTLVPDAPGQLTSDHGWDIARSRDVLEPIIARLKARGIRTSLFIDVDCQALELARQIGVDRVELYTEPYAECFGTDQATAVLARFRQTAEKATALGLGVNAGHDLNLQNLPAFLAIPGILEVSIGHALTVECLEYGINHVIAEYLKICGVP